MTDLPFVIGGARLTPGLAAVHQQLVDIVKDRRRAAILGGPGSGRTTILRALLQTLRTGGSAASLLQPGEPLPGRSHIVLMDDAHALGHDAWSALGLRTRPWVIAGLPSLRARMKTLRRLVVVGVPVISPSDVCGFVAGFLHQHDEPSDLLSDLAMTRLGVLSEGVPGRLVAIMRLAIFLARLEEAPVVEARHVKQAFSLGDETEELREAPSQDLPPPPRPARRHGLVMALATVGLASTILLPTRPRGTDQQSKAPAPFALVTPTVPTPPGSPAVATALARPLSYPLPATMPLHVVLLVDGSNTSQLRSNALAQMLRTNGYDVADPQPAPVGIATSEVRYYFADDAAGAAIVAEAVGIDATATRLASPKRGSQPRPGTIEIVTVGPPVSVKPT